MRRPDEEPLLEVTVENIFVDDPIEVNAIEVTPVSILSNQPVAPPERVKKKRPITKCLMTLILSVIIATVIAVFIPVKISSDLSTNSDEILLVGNFTKLSSTSTAWNSWACFYYDWEFSGSGDDSERDASITYTVSEDEQYDHVQVKCSNIFNYVLGISVLDWSIAAYNTDVKSSSDNSAIVSCPLLNPNGHIGTMFVNLTSPLMSSLHSSDLLFSSSCNGILIRMITRPNILTGVARYSSNVTLQDVFSTLSVVDVVIPLNSMTNNSHIATNTNTIHKAYHQLQAVSSLTMPLFHRTKWNLPFSSGSIATGSLYFEQIKWNTTPLMSQLRYTDSSLDVVMWTVTSTLVIDTVLVVQVTESGTISTIPLYTEVSPPSFIPTALLNMISITSLLNIDLQLNVNAAKLDSPYTATWRVSAEMTFEWLVKCTTAGGGANTCTGSVITSDVTLTSTPTGNTNYNTTNKQASISIDPTILISVGLQFNNVLSVQDTVKLALTLDATTILCPQMSLQISENAAVDLTFLTPILFVLFNMTVYSGDVISVMPDVRSLCVPTAQPTRLPSRQPSRQPSMRPSSVKPSVHVVGSVAPTRKLLRS